MDLTDDDVRAILKLLETSHFVDLELETPEFRLTLRRTDDGGWTRESATLRPAHAMASGHALRPAQPPAPAHAAAAAAVEPVAAAEPVAPGRADDPRSDLAAVRTPLPGTFYRSPKPGAPPFVELGSQVAANTVVAIVETMKLMNSVYAGVAGRVAEICLGDASFALQDAVLMRIEADPP
jgi:acetyl-CoA carboxylase biotin carboxyl carrier protein